MALTFISTARLNDCRLIADGDSFGVLEDEVIRVRHRPPEGDDVPFIELTVEKSPQHGIGIAPPPASPPPQTGKPVFGKRKSL